MYYPFFSLCGTEGNEAQFLTLHKSIYSLYFTFYFANLELQLSFITEAGFVFWEEFMH